MNFTYTLTQPSDGEWGLKQAAAADGGDGGPAFTGMVGELADDIIDIGRYLYMCTN